MSGPTRWRDDDSAPAEVRDLLRGVKGAARSHPLPAASRARSVARLDRMLALPVAAGLLLWLKGVAIAAGIGVLGVVAVKELPKLMSPGEAVTTVQDAPATSGNAAPKPLATARPTAAPSATTVADANLSSNAAMTPMAPPAPIAGTPSTASGPTSAASLPVETGPSAAGDSLAREAAMLDRARGLLGTDPTAALAALDAHAAAFPAGHMSLEREVLAVETLRRLHRYSEARARGESLLQRNPRSIYADRVRAILETLPAP